MANGVPGGKTSPKRSANTCNSCPSSSITNCSSTSASRRRVNSRFVIPSRSPFGPASPTSRLFRNRESGCVLVHQLANSRSMGGINSPVNSVASIHAPAVSNW